MTSLLVPPAAVQYIVFWSSTGLSVHPWHYVATPIGGDYPRGLLVVQNGEAPEPPNTGDVNGYEFDGATQFLFLDFRDALAVLDSIAN